MVRALRVATPSIPPLLRATCVNTRAYNSGKQASESGIYLEISALVERVGRTEDRDFPLKHVVLVDEFDAEALDWFLLQTLVLQGERP